MMMANPKNAAHHAAHKHEATALRGGLWAVRPVGALGTCGWSPYAWTVQYIRARSESEALRKAAAQ